MNPSDTINNLTSAINKGSMDEMLSFFDENAVLVAQALGEKEAQTARGKPAIRASYMGFLAMKPLLVRQKQKVVEAGDMALHFSSWTLSATTPAGKIERKGTSCDVLQRKNGKWLVLIYNPYGPEML